MKGDTRIYLDNNATTQADPRVVEVMVDLLRQDLGNPSSLHTFGQAARAALQKARRSIASYLHVNPSEIFFTSSGTEGANTLLRGLRRAEEYSILSSSAEHACVTSTLKALGCRVDYLEPGLWGAVQPEAVKEAIRSDTRLIILMAVNNETGVKTDIAAIAALAKEASIPLVVDGVALLGKEPFAIPDGVTAMFFSGHKIHAPAGTGFIYLRSGTSLNPLITGGEQEGGKRGGTENLIGIVGLAEAVRLLSEELPAATQRMQQLRDRLEEGLKQAIEGVAVNGLGPRIANISNLSFAGVEGETLLTQLDLEGVAASHGSACASGALEPSRVLRAMGLSSEEASSAIRFSLSRFTTQDEIERCIAIMAQLVKKLRNF